jgi:hypothetical protein
MGVNFFAGHFPSGRLFLIPSQTIGSADIGVHRRKIAESILADVSISFLFLSSGLGFRASSE